MIKKKLLLSVICVLFVLIFIVYNAFSNNEKNNVKKDIVNGDPSNNVAKNLKTLDTINNGLIFTYSNTCEKCTDIKKSIIELTNQYNVEIAFLNVNDSSDKAKLDKYYSDNKPIIDDIEKVSKYDKQLHYFDKDPSFGELNQKLTALEDKYGAGKLFNSDSSIPTEDLKQYVKITDELNNKGNEVNNKINQTISEARVAFYNLPNNGNGSPTPESEKKIKAMFKDITALQGLNEDEIYEYLKITSKPYPKRLVIDKIDFKPPIIFIVKDGIVIKNIEYGDPVFTQDVLSDPKKLTSFLTYQTGIINFQPSTQVEDLAKRIENKDSFVAYVYGNSCVHCNKLKPILTKILSDNNIVTQDVDIYIFKNLDNFEKLHEKYGLEQVNQTPTFIAFKDGKPVQYLKSDSWAINTPGAFLGYEFDQKVISDFLNKYAEKKK